MNRIDTLHIHNFKFFRDEEPLKLGGNNLLLYGENGSGKSSIYWALYTLFEASLKPEDNEIKKYFSKTIKAGRDNLINIHAAEMVAGSDDYDSYITITTDDATPKQFKISATDVAIRNSDDAKLTNYASDYINYRILLSFSSFRHSEPINLFELFAYNIFSYIKFAAIPFTIEGEVKNLTGVAEIWRSIERGPDEFDSEKEYQEEELSEYKESTPYKNYVISLAMFNDRLQGLIDTINLTGPEYLTKLGYSFSYVLAMQPATFDLKSKDFSLKPFSISISIPEYEGVVDPIKKPHSFLNEAKLSAIAISIRLAILRSKLAEACLKFVVLDDLLISLDMSNREKVLEVMLTPEFLDNYQLLVLTHDRNFFQLCKRKLTELSQTNWKYIEMYGDEENHRPLILGSDTFYSKAIHHLKSFDYPASANYFRKEAEEIFANHFPREVTISENGERKKHLKNYIDSAAKLYRRIGQSTANLELLDNYLFLLLNPLSHRAIENDIYRVELNRIRDLLPKIKNEVIELKFLEIVAQKSVLVIRFQNNATTVNEYFINTNEAIYLFNNNGIYELSNSKCKSFESVTISNGTPGAVVKNQHFTGDNIIDVHRKIYVRWTIPYDNSYWTNIFHQAFQTNQRTSLQNLI